MNNYEFYYYSTYDIKLLFAKLKAFLSKKYCKTNKFIML